MSFNNKTIEELHDLLVSKEISATELTQATLDDIKGSFFGHRYKGIDGFFTRLDIIKRRLCKFRC